MVPKFPKLPGLVKAAATAGAAAAKAVAGKTPKPNQVVAAASVWSPEGKRATEAARTAEKVAKTGTTSVASVTPTEAPPLKDFLGKLHTAAQPLDPATNWKFLAEPKGATDMKSLAAQLASAGPYLAKEDLPLAEAIKSPRALQLSSSYGQHKGGLAVWNNDVFPLDHFARNFDARAAGSTPTAAELLAQTKDAPWFEWNAAAKRVDFHAAGGDRRLLELLERSSGKGPVKLYRGTTAYESELLDLQRKLEKNALPTDWRSRLEKSLKQTLDHAKTNADAWVQLEKDKLVTPAEAAEKVQALKRRQQFFDGRVAGAKLVKGDEATAAYLRDSLAKLIDQGSFQGIFVTPDAKRAALFSKGRVVGFQLTHQQLEEALKSNRLYVGMEKIGDQPALELGLFPSPTGGSAELARALTDAYASSTVKAAGQLFN